MQHLDLNQRGASWRKSVENCYKQREVYHDIVFIIGRDQIPFYAIKGVLGLHSQVFRYVNLLLIYTLNSACDYDYD